MRAPHLLRLAIALSLAVGFTASSGVAGEITPRLADELRLRAPGELTPVIIIMDESPDLAALASEVAPLPKEERRARVVSRLREESRALQEPILRELGQLEAEGEVSAVRSHWAAPMISAEVTPEVARLMARRPDVAAVDYDGLVYMLDGSGPRAEIEPDATRTGYTDRAIAWGVTWIGADQVWNLGYQGEGVLVAVLDTGIWYQHSDLTNRMWTNDLEYPPDGDDDDGNGYIDDYYGYNFNGNNYDPNDDHGHGTHCSGTVAGDGTGGTQTGVAPQANLMACKVLNSGGYGQPSDVEEAIEYAVDNGAHVMSLSIGWFEPETWIRQLYRHACETARLAGVTMCVAAGNERGWGQPPNLIRTPGDVPPPWIHPDNTSTGDVGGVTTCGATAYQSDNIAYFSSDGPVHWQSVDPWYDWNYPPGLIKPDVCAPGENINSTVRFGGYSGNSWSGTSMATPHVAGTAALMLSRDLALLPADVDRILEETALPRGAAGKDNDYGSGRIQALEAVEAVTPDDLAPAAVTDLATAPVPGYGRIRLNWTAPGDDGLTGTASEYDVRYRLAVLGPIDTEAKWDVATQAINEPAPQPAGTPETMVIGTLAPGQSYYFALKAADEVPNWSGLSNSPHGTASGQPPSIGRDAVIIDGEGRLIHVQGDRAAITQVGLAQSYPNPLVERTEIAFALPESAPVSVRIYAVTGKLVRVLADEQYAGGLHRVAWDGHDEAGRPVPNGVYFYRLDTPERTLGRKLTVLH